MSLQVFDYDKEQEELNNNSEEDEDQIEHFNSDNFRCPHCNSTESTLLEKEASFLTYILALTSLFLFGFLSIIIMPLIIQSSKTIVRRCSDCNEVVEQTNLFSLPSLKDEIMNFRCGNCSVVISRKYALVLIGIFAVCYLYYIMTKPPTITVQQPEIQSLKWEQFVKDCGQTVQLNNEVKAKQIFDKKYKNRVAEWQGVLLGIRTNQLINSFQVLEQSFAYVYLKMNPTDSAYESADIRFDYDRYSYERDLHIYQQLDVGSMIKFKAKFINLGDEQSPNVMDLISLENLNQRMDIHEIPLIELSEDVVEDDAQQKLRKKKGEKSNSSHPHHKSHSNKQKTSTKQKLINHTHTISENKDNLNQTVNEEKQQNEIQKSEQEEIIINQEDNQNQQQENQQQEEIIQDEEQNSNSNQNSENNDESQQKNEETSINNNENPA